VLQIQLYSRVYVIHFNFIFVDTYCTTKFAIFNIHLIEMSLSKVTAACKSSLAEVLLA
jgi:hypothetical protein